MPSNNRGLDACVTVIRHEMKIIKISLQRLKRVSKVIYLIINFTLYVVFQ